MVKFAVYSDLHLESSRAELPVIKGDIEVVILAGDICCMEDDYKLKLLLHHYPNITFVHIPGNHEYYTKSNCSMEDIQDKMIDLQRYYTNYVYLDNKYYYAGGGVVIIGSTLWTDYNKQNPIDIEIGRTDMNDYRHIFVEGGRFLSPEDTIILHQSAREYINRNLKHHTSFKTIVATHHNPVRLQDSRHKTSNRWASFDCTDMEDIIHEYQPAVWISGHTHESHDYTLHGTRMLSNQRGYPRGKLGNVSHECQAYDPDGKVFEL